MLRRATLLLLLLPGFALGQTVGGTVTASVSTQGSSGQANRAECKSTTSTATWNIVATGVTISAGDKWRLATASATGCGTTVPTTFIQDQLATGATQSISGVFVQPMATEGGVSNCDQANDVQIVLCAYYLPGGLAPATVQVVQGTFNFQLAVPPAPNITGVSPGDGQLTVAVTPGTTTATETATSGVTFTVTCTPPTGGAGVSVNGNAGNVICSGLTNGVAYTITASGKSAANNPGAASAAFGPNASTTPLPFLSFWDVYKNDGGVEAGGCGTGGAGALAPALALLALLAARRRRS